MMSLRRCGSIGLLAAAVVVSIDGAQSSPPDRPWPPPVQKVPDTSPPLPPEAALQTFYMPPGYRLELVASEPLVQEPVAMDWDTGGRLWVVEMPGFMADLTGSNELEPIGRVAVLEDTDADGRMDKRTLFADKLVLARSIKVLDRGVLVAEPPHVWLMRDTDGDLRMDTKELVTDAYGRREADPQNNANGFYWALDNRMYTAGQADVHLQLEDGTFQVHRTLRRGEWGVTGDDTGRIYRNTNESALHVDLVPTAYFARNPHLVRARGSYERLADGNPDLNIVWPVRPNPGTNRAYQAGIGRPDGSLARFTSVCAPTVYRGDRLPMELYGSVFVAEPAANLVSRIVVEDDGTTLQARKAYEQGEFLASTDERFRPVYFANAPDGTLYVADMYRGIIEHRISITMYLRDQILERKLDQGTGFGRIYRVVHETTRRDLAPFPASATPAQLVELLSHPNGWWRDTAQRVLVERGAKGAVPALVRLASEAGDWRTRLHALWTLDGLDAIEPALVIKALEDRSRDVRASALRLAERWVSGPQGEIVLAAAMRRLDDADWAVRQGLAAFVGSLPPGPREALAVPLLERYGEDPVVTDATLSGLGGAEGLVLDLIGRDANARDASRASRRGEGGGSAPDASSAAALTAARYSDQSPHRHAAMTMLAATAVRSGQEELVQDLFARTADPTRPLWQRSAILRGAEIALLGAEMPGSRRAVRAAAPPALPRPCPTCPGGRAGPGGAYAFPRPADWPQSRRDSGAALQLQAEPLAMTRLAAEPGELGVRAAALLARVSWPGKAGHAAADALSAEEQARFDAGREVYRNLCQACHQPDGRGQEKVAPSLLGSPLALAPPEIPARILLNGKEGATGLMPPIGTALGDEQLASVLTYIRREWGNAGSGVTAEMITRIRGLTAARARPWTDAELIELMKR